MTAPPPGFAQVLSLAQQGRLAEARKAAEQLLAGHPDNTTLLRFLGDLCAHAGGHAAAAGYLRRAVAGDPADGRARTALAGTLIQLRAWSEARAVCAAGTPPEAFARLSGFIAQSSGDTAEAIRIYEQVLAQAPDDWEIWNNLGNVRRAAGDLDGAIVALGRAAALKPDQGNIQSNLGAALAMAGRYDESLTAMGEAARIAPRDGTALLELSRALNRVQRHRDAVRVLEQAIALAPADPALRIEMGLTEELRGDRAAAERAWRAAIGMNPKAAEPYQELGALLEAENRLDDAARLIDEAQSNGVDTAELALLRALMLRRRGDDAAALAAAQRIDPAIDSGRRAKLIGEISDRLGDSDTAFAAFAEMNAHMAARPEAPRIAGAAFRDRFRRAIALTTPEWLAGWTTDQPEPTRPAPAFLIGFPRSGTTLSDTILMGHSRTVVFEEEPFLARVAEAVGDPAALATMDATTIATLRARYFAAADAAMPGIGDRLIVDKMPFSILHLPLIHRLFPDARVVFVERHPCDVVLSCYMQNFRPNPAMASFLDLGDAAELYDLALGYWQQCRSVLPLPTHILRYEEMVTDLEGAVRPLLAFLGLAWEDAALDHQRTALERGHVRTASYAQVTEPLYTRARGRWQRYRSHLAPVLPILEPWVRRLGYDTADPAA
ncbi:sulfotransferase [Sphingomonas flavalba]|uniref:tetratricopeptide repeat-containing sulfotransferase family protein n=1 Tax=Sphingomonas flavalba TaxID=2559804 RepID=UPI0039DFC5E2